MSDKKTTRNIFGFTKPTPLPDNPTPDPINPDHYRTGKIDCIARSVEDAERIVSGTN